MTRRPNSQLFLLLICMSALANSGCEMLRTWIQPRPAVIVDANPSLATVANIVNQNSARVTSLQSSNASISSSQMPGSLSANLAMQRNRRFRLKADFALSGTEVDLGSNDEQFWVWVRRGNPKALYFCRHDEFHRSQAQAILPVQPEWLIDAFGLTMIDPNGNYVGPEPVGRGRLRLTSTLQTARGPLTKVTVVDAQYGDVLEQHLYDGTSQLIASALMSEHKKYALPEAQGNPTIYLPHHVELIFPQTDMTLTVDVGSFEINQIGGGASPLWERPQIAGYPLVNLADPNLRLTPITGAPQGNQQPGNAQPYGTQPYGAQPHGAEYGGDVAPVSYPGGAAAGANRASYPSGGSAFASDGNAPAVPQQSSRETVVSPPPRYDSAGRVLR